MELDAGSWVMFKLPGFTTAAAGTEQDSLHALRDASESSWFKADDALWVKLVSTADIPGRRPRDQDSLQVSR
jgi:cell migration-inducing and hyaluronan-binding protein